MRRRPRPWVCSAPSYVAGVFLLRGASGFLPSGSLGRVSSSGVSSFSSFALQQHDSTGSLAKSFGARGSSRRRKRVGYERLLQRSGLPAGAAAIVEEEPAGSDEAVGGVQGAAGWEGLPGRGGPADDSVAHDEGRRTLALAADPDAGGVVQEQGRGESSSTSADGVAAHDGDGSPTSVFTIMSLCFLVAIVCALDRVAMSVAIVPMGNVYDYTDTTKGLISSVFSWGYMASMIPSSVLIGVWGPKATITAGVLVWSAAQMLSPAAAGVSLETLLACRFCMGLGEAVTMPSIQAIVAEWVPQDQRSGWLALIISGLQIGTVLAYWASPLIVDKWDWQTMFLAYGGLGLVWVTLWLPLVSDRSPSSAKLAATKAARAARAAEAAPSPAGIQAAGTPKAPAPTAAAAAVAAAADAALPGGERIANGDGGGSETSAAAAALALPVQTVVLEERSGTGGGEAAAAAPDGPESRATGGGRRGAPREGGVLEGFLAVPWKEYATNGQIWSIAAAHMSHNWGLYVLLAWLPTYFVQEFNLTLGESSGASVVPWVAGAISGNMAGLGADFLVKKGLLDVRSVRKLFQTVALVGPAACMLALAQGPETSAEASRLFTAAVALGSCSCAGFGSSVQDLRSRDTGVIYGMTSACAAVWGSVGTYGAGVILDTTDSWTTVFQSCAAVYMAGALVYGTFYKAEPLAVEGRNAVL